MAEQRYGEGKGVSLVDSERRQRSGGGGSGSDVFQKQKCGRCHS